MLAACVLQLVLPPGAGYSRCTRTEVPALFRSARTSGPARGASPGSKGPTQQCSGPQMSGLDPAPGRGGRETAAAAPLCSAHGVPALAVEHGPGRARCRQVLAAGRRKPTAWLSRVAPPSPVASRCHLDLAGPHEPRDTGNARAGAAVAHSACAPMGPPVREWR